MSGRKSGLVTHARPTQQRRDISASTSSALSAAVSDGVSLVHVRNDTGALAYIAMVSTGGAVTTANGFPLASGTAEYFKVNPGERVAAILASGTGTIVVSEMTL